MPRSLTVCKVLFGAIKRLYSASSKRFLKYTHLRLKIVHDMSFGLKRNSWAKTIWWDALIAPMIIRRDLLLVFIYSCVHFSLCFSLQGINNVHKCACTRRHTPYYCQAISILSLVIRHYLSELCLLVASRPSLPSASFCMTALTFSFMASSLPNMHH